MVWLSQVSCCHFSPLNGFNCPDDLNQKTITKGKSSTGNYCLHCQIELTWTEQAPFTVVKLHVQTVTAIVMQRWTWSVPPAYVSSKETEEDSDTSKWKEQGAAVWGTTHTWSHVEEFRTSCLEKNNLKRNAGRGTFLINIKVLLHLSWIFSRIWKWS